MHHLPRGLGTYVYESKRAGVGNGVFGDEGEVGVGFVGFGRIGEVEGTIVVGFVRDEDGHLEVGELVREQACRGATEVGCVFRGVGNFRAIYVAGGQFGKISSFWVSGKRCGRTLLC